MTDGVSSILRRATDALEEIFFVFTPEGDIIEWNKRVNEVTGYSDEEIGQMHPADLVPAEDADLIQEKIAQVLKEGDVRFEGRLKTKGRREVPYEFTGSLIEEDGQVLICGTGRDITEKNQAKEELEASEERYRRLFEDSQEGIMVTTPQGEILEANPTAEDIFGYSREELQSLNAAELYANPEERKAIASELNEEGAIVGREARFQRADGKEIVCEISGAVHRRGGEERWEAFFRDVTERKEAEEALKESEETFRKLAENALVGIGLIQDGTYEYVNPALSRITGYSKEELLGESPEIFVHPEDWSHVRRQVESRLEGEAEEVHYEARFKTKSGEIRHVEVSGTRIGYQGEAAAIATIQDVTERRHMQQEMVQVQEEERRRIGQELHDSVASQLTGATLKLNLLSEKVQAEEAEEGLREVQSIIEGSASDVRRLSRGLNPGGLSEGNLPSALQGLAEGTGETRFENLLEGKDAITEEGEEEEGTSTIGEEVPTHLYRIAQEATTNAQRHGEASQIEIRLKQEDGALVLEVEDNGKGFDPSEADTEGLGLRSMRNRAELLGAELEVESSPGEGTLVRCLLPM